MLTRFDPLRELDELADRLRDGRRTRSMPLDAYRIADVLHVDLDLPGVKQARARHIQVSVSESERAITTASAG
jgi:HSP20 family molecular chaperone IbpA